MDSRTTFNPKLYNPKTRGITINTDASFCPITKSGGWAFYIVCDSFKIKKSGNFKALCTDSLDAELRCIGNAITELLSLKEFPKLSYLYCNTDCKNAIRIINTRETELGEIIKANWDSLASALGVNTKKFRHVKAHSSVNDARSFVNEWCDKEAKKFMRSQREQIKKLK